MLTQETRLIQREERERNLRFVLAIIDGEQFPPEDGDNYLHITQNHFELWKNKVKSLIQGRLT